MASRPSVELRFHFQGWQIGLDEQILLYQHPFPYHGLDDVPDGDGDGDDGDVVPRPLRVPLSSVVDAFRPLQAIDFSVDEVRYISRETDFFPVASHSSQLQGTTLLCEGILPA